MTEREQRIGEIEIRAENPSLLFNSVDAHIAITEDVPYLLAELKAADAKLAIAREALKFYAGIGRTRQEPERAREALKRIGEC